MRCTLRSSDGALDACDAAAASAVRPQAPANNAMTRVAAPQTPPWADAGASVFVHMDTSHLDTGASRRKARRPERRSDAGRSPVAWLLEAIGRPGDGAATWVQVSAECGEYGPGARVPLAHLPEHRRRINPAITRPVNGPRSSAAGIAGHGTGISGHLAKSSWLPIHCTRAASIRVREPGYLQPSCPRATRLPAMDEEAPVEHFYRLAMAGLARMTRPE